MITNAYARSVTTASWYFLFNTSRPGFIWRIPRSFSHVIPNYFRILIFCNRFLLLIIPLSTYFKLTPVMVKLPVAKSKLASLEKRAIHYFPDRCHVVVYCIDFSNVSPVLIPEIISSSLSNSLHSAELHVMPMLTITVAQNKPYKQLVHDLCWAFTNCL